MPNCTCDLSGVNVQKRHRSLQAVKWHSASSVSTIDASRSHLDDFCCAAESFPSLHFQALQSAYVNPNSRTTSLCDATVIDSMNTLDKISFS